MQTKILYMFHALLMKLDTQRKVRMKGCDMDNFSKPPNQSLKLPDSQLDITRMQTKKKIYANLSSFRTLHPST